MRVVLCTAPKEEAPALARKVVSEKLAACVNIVPAVRSIYSWKGELCDDQEALMIIKTEARLVEELTSKLVEMHSYDVPEVIAIPMEKGEGNAKYLEWLSSTVR